MLGLARSGQMEGISLSLQCPLLFAHLNLTSSLKPPYNHSVSSCSHPEAFSPILRLCSLKTLAFSHHSVLWEGNIVSSVRPGVQILPHSNQLCGLGKSWLSLRFGFSSVNVEDWSLLLCYAMSFGLSSWTSEITLTCHFGYWSNLLTLQLLFS